MPLDWEDLVYRVSRRVGFVTRPATPVDWLSNGARIELHPVKAKHEPAVLHLRLTNGHKHRIIGSGLEIDGGLKAAIGIYFDQPRDDAVGEVFAMNLRVRNIACVPGVGSGSGIRIRGGYRCVRLINPHVADVWMGRGAGVPGRIGVNGIMITRANSDKGEGAPLFVHVISPHIENIGAKDNRQLVDMDGLVIFGALHTDACRPFDECLIEGGLWRNCWGRDIKIQMGGGRVVGGRFEHFSGPLCNTLNSSIAFQWGLGSVENCSHHFVGISPAEIVNFATGVMGAQVSGRYANSGYVIRNAKAQTICRLFPRRSEYPDVILKNIKGCGPANYAVTCHLSSRPGNLSLWGLRGSFDTAFIKLLSTPGFEPGQIRIFATECVNYGIGRLFVANHLPGQQPEPKTFVRGNAGKFW